jgi:hypothetical protein
MKAEDGEIPSSLAIEMNSNQLQSSKKSNSTMNTISTIHSKNEHPIWIEKDVAEGILLIRNSKQTDIQSDDL